MCVLACVRVEEWLGRRLVDEAVKLGLRVEGVYLPPRPLATATREEMMLDGEGERMRDALAGICLSLLMRLCSSGGKTEYDCKFSRGGFVGFRSVRA